MAVNQIEEVRAAIENAKRHMECVAQEADSKNPEHFDSIKAGSEIAMDAMDAALSALAGGGDWAPVDDLAALRQSAAEWEAWAGKAFVWLAEVKLVA